MSDGTPLRPCHSAHSHEIYFKRNRDQCVQCPQFSTCQQETLRRLNQKKGTRQSMAAQHTTPRQAPQYSAPPPNPQYQRPAQYTSPQHHYALSPETLLQFDILPEEGEHLLERMFWNSVSAGAAAVFNEASTLMRHVRLGKKGKS